MKYKVFSLLLLMCAVLLGGCSGGGSSGAVYHKITPQEAKSMMDGAAGAYTLVDVRTQSEFQAQRIAGAILIPYDQIAGLAASELPDKDALIFTYCRTGVRSSAAAHTLVGLGYTNVYDIGGIQSWPYGTVSG